MRRRLVVGAVAVVTLAMLSFAVPLAVVLRQQIVRAELDGFSATLEQTATFVDERARTCAEVQFLVEGLTSDDVDTTVFVRGGVVWFAVGEPLDGIPAVLTTAIGGVTGAALVDGDPVAAAPLSTSRCGERLVLQSRTDGDELARRIRRSMLLIVLAGVVAIGAAAVAASGLGARLARPLERLAASARRLGDGDFSERAPRSGLDEPDGIAEALDVTADRLGRAVTRGSAFAADASHQLRTPLTALRLQLETLEATSDVDGVDPVRRETLAGALAEVDRLTATIEELVALTQVDVVGEIVDVTALVVERAQDWVRRADELGREVVVAPARPALARVRAAAVLQATDVLVDNALRHGRGPVTVEVGVGVGVGVGAAGAAGESGTDGWLAVVVGDEGPGLPPDLDVHGDRIDRGALPLHGGRGLVLARDLIEGEGGRLVLTTDPRGTRAKLLIPAVAPRGGDESRPAP